MGVTMRVAAALAGVIEGLLPLVFLAGALYIRSS